MNEQLTGSVFKQMVLHGAAAITAQKQSINDLNVFPVPDGDTGTNMSMTINTAASAPVFDISGYGAVADYRSLVPALIKEIKKRRGTD